MSTEKLNLREFAPTLREHGFTKEYDMFRRSKQCARVVEYTKQVGNRLLVVQLWGDGIHRATHWLGRRMTTTPTYFENRLEMLTAIQHELKRKDHPKQ